MAFGGRELGKGSPDRGKGAAFEFPDELAVLFRDNVVVFWGWDNDYLMLKNLYGENALEEAYFKQWVIADLQKWFSFFPCTGGRRRSQIDNAVGVKNAWQDLCADDAHATSLKDLPTELLMAGDGRLHRVALAAVTREELVSDSAHIARAYAIRDVTYLIHLSFYCYLTFPPVDDDPGLVTLREKLKEYLKVRQARIESVERDDDFMDMVRKYDSEGSLMTGVKQALTTLKGKLIGSCDTRWHNITSREELIGVNWAIRAIETAASLLTLFFTYVHD
ncbi:MAG: hypothetical protein GY738_13645, partial [Pseudoalteromonas sp.]|nr:hypothetical protein [Pseudoalteromonas sp.]